MTVRDMQCFITACEKHSISAAAEASYISPQGASKAVKKMEEEVGAPLLIRTSQGVQPTEYGKIFLEHARCIVDMYSATVSEIQDLVKQNTGFLRLASAFGILRLLSPEFISTFTKQHPDMNLDYMEYPDIYIGQDVLDGKYDVGLIPYIEQDPDLIYVPLFSKEIYFVTHKGSRFYDRDMVSLHEVMDEPLIIENQNFVIHHIIRNLCTKEGILPDFYFKTSGFSLCYKFCREEKANTVSMDFIFQDMSEGLLRRIPFTEHPMWNVALIRRNSMPLSPCLHAFRDYTEAWCRRLSATGNGSFPVIGDGSSGSKFY